MPTRTAGHIFSLAFAGAFQFATPTNHLKNTIDSAVCGSRGVKFFKLHKVGSTTVSDQLVLYMHRYPHLTHCTNTCQMSQKKVVHCDVQAGHLSSEGLLTRADTKDGTGLETWFSSVASRNTTTENSRPEGWAPPITAVVLRE